MTPLPLTEQSQTAFAAYLSQSLEIGQMVINSLHSVHQDPHRQIGSSLRGVIKTYILSKLPLV